MANVSRWKNFEAEVGEALGGKRRFRTTENFGKEASDVLFPKYVRLAYPKLNRVEVECKKRKALNIHALYAEAVMKYGKDAVGRDKVVVLAHKVPMKGEVERRVEEMKKEVRRRYAVGGPLFLKRKARWLKQKKGRKKLSPVVLDAIKRILDKDAQEIIKTSEKKLRLRFSTKALVTVSLPVFVEMFDAWLGRKNGNSSDQ
jgi:hypothetical protein